MMTLGTSRKLVAVRLVSLIALALILESCLVNQRLNAQQAAGSISTSQQTTTRGVELDRVIAVVNDDVILESDVDEENRLTAFQPFRDTSRSASREQVIDRLINRSLILQQSKIQAEGQVTDKQVQDQLTSLKKEIPACKEYRCDTDAGWQRFVEDQGFTMEELTQLWHERMQVLSFIEIRFRSGITISDGEIQHYYDKTLLPQYAKQGAIAPKIVVIKNRIQEILLQQQVGSLLGDWLKSLRAQGTVRTVQQGEDSR
jgi:peptidyl-prolyl cis-trans isomerase SurA